MWHGMFLFFLGLVTGLLEQRFTNMRMGVSAHLEGVMNGTFLIVPGAIWTEVRLSPPVKTTAFWIAIYGTYANWFFTTLDRRCLRLRGEQRPGNLVQNHFATSSTWPSYSVP
jgi:hydroxylaminobenzene mutase